MNIAAFLKNQTVLITGGTGSFGRTMARALSHYDLKEIRIYSRSEDKQEEMRYQFRDVPNTTYILGDVRDFDQLSKSMADVDYVFHAAAQKHVPTSEYNVLEAVKTNVLGAQNVIQVCIINKVKKVIAISTDKAVEPINVMGMTKALQEKLFIEGNILKNNKQTIFACVRYGNVLGSTGSVLPLFIKQMKENSALSITHKDMTRFIITLDQAVNLVFTTLTKAVGGEIFVPDIPSHTVYDLARAVLTCTRKTNGIKEIGIRVGEKIHETLITPTETLRTIKRIGYFIVLPQIIIPITQKTYKHRPMHTPLRYSSDTSKMIGTNDLIVLVKKFLIDNDSDASF